MAERQQMIISELSQRSRASVAELAAATKSSEMTIRRDLEQLEIKGVLRRIHGGAISLLLAGVEPPFSVRFLLRKQQKKRLAAAAAAMLINGETVIVDTGTTGLAVAHAMRGQRLTVTPLSLHSAEVLSKDEGVTLLIPGGQVRPGELSIVGDLAEGTFERLRYDTFILGCCGVDAVDGATAHTLEDVRVKRAAIRAARRVIAVATSDKIGRVTFGQICTMEQLDVIITDTDATEEQLEGLRRTGVRVVTV